MNLFSAQGQPQEFKSIGVMVTRTKSCCSCEKRFPINVFPVTKTYVNKIGKLTEYRDSYCPKCRSSKSINSNFRKSDKYKGYQREFHKNYNRKIKTNNH